ncbi:MAG: ATP synthase F0 subunit C [Deltaproteobacteria bacterium]|nr:ATP synthase F0 subunit C [Deltaproteobacteria bacterium]
MSKKLSRMVVGVVVFLTGVLVPALAFAADAVEADNAFSQNMYLALAAGFGIAVAAFGGALAQGKAAAAALEGIARNPGAAGKILTPMILALALIESLVIYALIIAFVLSGKIG